MKESRLRFTTQEKLVILRDVHFIGLEPALLKYHLSVEVLIRWQRKFKGSTAGNSIHLGEDMVARERVSKTKPVKLVVSEKEDALLRLVASLIVQSVLEKDMPDR